MDKSSTTNLPPVVRRGWRKFEHHVKHSFTKSQWGLLFALSAVNLVAGLIDSIQAPTYNPNLTNHVRNPDSDHTSHHHNKTYVKILDFDYVQDDIFNFNLSHLNLESVSDFDEEGQHHHNSEEKRRENASDTSFGLFIGGFDITQLLLSPLIGATIHIIGPRNAFMAGVFIDASSTTLFGLLNKVQDLTLRTIFFFIARLVTAAGSSAMFIAIYTILTIEFPRTLALAFAIIHSVNGLGKAIGPVVGSILFPMTGFTLLFIGLGLAHYFLAFLTYIILPKTDDDLEKLRDKQDIKSFTIQKPIGIDVKGKVEHEASPSQASLPVEANGTEIAKRTASAYATEKDNHDLEEKVNMMRDLDRHAIKPGEGLGGLFSQFKLSPSSDLENNTKSTGYTKLKSAPGEKGSETFRGSAAQGGSLFGFNRSTPSGVISFHSKTKNEDGVPEDDVDEFASKCGVRGFISLFKIPAILMYSLGVVITALISGFVASIVQPHLLEYHMATIPIGKLFLLFGTAGSVFSIVWGFIVGRAKNPEFITLFGSILMLISILPIGPIPFVMLTQPDLRWTTGCIVLLGLGMGAINIAAFVLSLDEAKANGFPEDGNTSGLISSIFVTSLGIGGFAGPAIASYLYKYYGFRDASLFVFLLSIILTIGFALFLCMKNPLVRERSSRETSTSSTPVDETTPLLSEMSTSKYYYHVA